jgi:hypothetical protein
MRCFVGGDAGGFVGFVRKSFFVECDFDFGGRDESRVRPFEVPPEGGYHDQADAVWIVIRRPLEGHNGTPSGRPTPGRPVGRPGVGHPKGAFGVFS